MPIARRGPAQLRIGTCSWKFPSWAGLVYSAPDGVDYLREYAHHFDTVEIDQWFWSLHSPDRIALPRAVDAQAYRHAVPDDFRFTLKVPNSITLTHYYQRAKGDPLIPNPGFLSKELLIRFLARIKPLHDLLEPYCCSSSISTDARCPRPDCSLRSCAHLPSSCPRSLSSQWRCAIRST